jgi:multidrug efflux pump subunit AcrA (membrane-fusion protein)
MRRRKQVLLVGAAVMIGAGLAVYGRSSRAVSVVDERELRERIVADAMVVPIEGVAELRARVDGVVAEVFVHEGDRVRPGQRVARLVNPAVSHEVARRQAEYLAARALVGLSRQRFGKHDLAALKADLAASRSHLALQTDRRQRARALVEAGAMTEADWHAADLSLEEQKATVEAVDSRLQSALAGGRPAEIQAARERAESARALLAAVEAQRADLDLVAPVAGVIVARRIDPGDTVLRDGGAPLIEIADLDQVEIRIEVEERDSMRLATGLVAEVASATGGPMLRCTITRLSARFERRTLGANDARLRADSMVRPAFCTREGAWPPLALNEHLEMAIEVPPVRALTVPRQAVRVRNGRAVVRVPALFTAREHEVELGRTDRDVVEIRGLPGGAVVLLE